MIEYEGVEYAAWKHGKDSYEPYSELDDKPLDLVCELTRAPAYEGARYGVCRVKGAA